MSRRGEINGWTCDKCGETTYCVHVDDGVTPMFLSCRVTGSVEDCEGTGTSMMYPAPPAPDYVLAAVRWEWYRPDPRRKRFNLVSRKFFTPPDPLTPKEREHVNKGGLLLRELSDAGRTALAEQGEEAGDG